MIRIIVFLLFFLSGCTSQKEYSNIVRIENRCSSDIDVFIQGYVSGSTLIYQHNIHLPVGDSDVLVYFPTADIDDGFKYEGEFMIYKDSRGELDYPFTISLSGREKKFGKNDLIRLSRDISTKDDRKYGVIRYIIDSQEICP